jgi:hypothetical protein
MVGFEKTLSGMECDKSYGEYRIFLDCERASGELPCRSDDVQGVVAGR